MSPRVGIDAAKLDALFEPFDRTDRPGLVVGVAHRGVPVYRRGFGLASVELPQALTPQTRLRIGSTSKHVTCLGIMLLAEAGLLAPEDPVRRHLPELGGWADGITLAHLMSHTSGARCTVDLLGFTAGALGRAGGPPSAAQFRLLVSADSVNFAPGAAFVYCNGGYVLLTEIIRRLSGQSFESFLRDRIFGPAGLHDTLARPLDTDCVPNSATLHLPDGDGWRKGFFGLAIGGEGSIVSTVDDMLRWLAHMARPVVGSAESWARLRRPVTLAGGAKINYGFGLFLDRYRGLDTVHHAGGVVGGSSQMLTVPSLALDIVIMTNMAGPANPKELAHALIDLSVEGLAPAEDLSDPDQRLDGAYFSRASGRFVRLWASEGRQMLTTGGVEAPVKRRSDGSVKVLQTLNPETRVTLAADDIVWTDHGTVDRLTRLPDAGSSSVATIAGRYAAAEFGLAATVEATADGAGRLCFESAFGRLAYDLTGWAPNLWTAATADLVTPASCLPLERSGDDLLFTTGRTIRLRLAQVA